MKEKRIKVIVTDDQELFRKGLIELLDPKDIQVIAEACNGVELIYLLEVEKLKPDLILLDLDMPEMDGKEALKKIREKDRETKIIILSTFTEGCLINDAISKGASSYLSKNSDVNTINETIRRVYRLEGYSNVSEKAKSIFTDGEIKVIPLLLAGKKKKQIAEALGLKEKTIEHYVTRLYDKTDTSNGLEFSSYCTRVGLEFLS